MKTGCELLMAQLLRATDNSHGWSSLPNPCCFSLAPADVTDDCKRPRESEGKY